MEPSPPAVSNFLSTARILDHLPSPAYAKDREHRLVYANPAAAEAFGKDISSLLGAANEDLFSANLADALTLLENAVFDSGEIQRTNTPVAVGKNEYRLTFAPSPFEDGSALPQFLIVHTEELFCRTPALEQERLRLHETHERFRFIVDATPDPMSLVDRDYVFEAVNPAYCALAGKPAHEIEGRSIARVWGEDTFHDQIKLNLDTCFSGEKVTLEAWFSFGRDRQRFYHVSYNPYINARDEVTHVVVISRDATNEKKAEQALLEAHDLLEERVEERTRALLKLNKSLQKEIAERMQAETARRKGEQKYRELVENARSAIIRCAPDGTVTFFNEYAQQFFGFSEPDILGRPLLGTIVPETDSTGRDLAALLKDLFLHPERHAFTEIETVRRDGTRAWVSWTNKAVFSSRGDFSGLLSIGMDITQQKKIQAELENANRAKGEFLANMSHEIRTPLNGIIGMTELGLENTADQEEANILETIQAEAGELLGIINHILDFSKIEAGKLELEAIPFDLEYLLQSLSLVLSFRARKKDLESMIFLAPGTPTRLSGDPGRLRQILTNLMDNALKFTDKGSVAIRIEAQEETPEDALLCFSVQDTGIGIPQEKQTSIFNSFTQADGSTTRKYGGTGLGTTIAQQLAEMMDGEIGLESTPGEGSTFWFTARFAKHIPRPDQELRSAQALPVGLNVLLIGYDSPSLDQVADHLRNWGCDPIPAEDYAQAMAVLERRKSGNAPISLIILDSRQRGTDGFSLTRALKTHTQFQDIPIIMAASQGAQGDYRRCRELEIRAYLARPFEAPDLRGTMEAVLEDAASQDVITVHTLAEDTRKNVRILLVEDYPTNQEVAIQHLSRAGYRVDLAQNGRQALDLFSSKSYNLVLMDVQMPGMDGFEATRAIRKMEQESQSARTPVVAMTAHARQEIQKKCRDAGMDDFLTKPLRKDTFLPLVRQWTEEAGEKPPFKDIGPDPAPDPASADQDFPLDYDRALEEFAGNKPVVDKLILLLLNQAETDLEDLRQAVGKGADGLEDARKTAHKIKGGALNLAADPLAQAAREMEEAAMEKNSPLAERTLTLLEDRFTELEVYVAETLGITPQAG